MIATKPTIAGATATMNDKNQAFFKTLGSRIAEARKERRLTQAQLAEQLGIPIEAAVLLLIGSASVLIWSNSPVYAALVVAFGYSISRLIVRHDVNAFRLLFLWGRTKLGNRNRAFWGGSS